MIEETIFLINIRSSHRMCSIWKGVLRSFVKFTGKHLCQSLSPATLLEKRLWHRCFPVNIAKFLRTPFWKNTSGRLLLKYGHGRKEKTYHHPNKLPILFCEYLIVVLIMKTAIYLEIFGNYNRGTSFSAKNKSFNQNNFNYKKN